MGGEILAMLAELRPETHFEESADFIEDDLLDSFDIIALVSMIEERYGIKIDALDIRADNFCNADTIENLVVRSKK